MLGLKAFIKRLAAVLLVVEVEESTFKVGMAVGSAVETAMVLSASVACALRTVQPKSASVR